MSNRSSVKSNSTSVSNNYYLGGGVARNLYFDSSSNYWFPNLNASQIEIWLISVFTLLFALIGFCIYLRVIFIICKFKSTTFSNPFYTVVLYLAIPDCLYLFIQITFGFLFTVIGFKNVPLLMVVITGYINTVCSYSEFALVCFMGCNRYVAICHFHKYSRWFERRRVHITCCVCFLLGIALSIPDTLCQCYSFKADFAWKFECKVTNLKTKVDPDCFYTILIVDHYTILIVDHVFYAGFIIFIPLINFLTLMQYFFKQRQIRNILNVESGLNKKDVSLLIQFCLISLVFVLYLGIFWYQDQMATSIIPLDVAITLLAILNSSVNPYLYLTFSNDIRSKLWKASSVVPQQ